MFILTTSLYPPWGSFKKNVSAPIDVNKGGEGRFRISLSIPYEEIQ